MIKRVIILFVIFSLCFCSIAFADDLEPVQTDSSPSAIDADIDNELRTLANTIYRIESDNGTRATTRTIDDIYNIIVQIFYNQSNGTNEIVVMRQFLNTINTSCNSLVVKLVEFYNSINPDYDTTGISIYDTLHSVVTALTTIDPNDGDLTIIETLVYITSALDDLHTDLVSILNSNYSIDSKLVNINTAIVQFKSDLISSISTLNTDMNTGFTNVNANMAQIINNIQLMNNDFNNINWRDSISGKLYDSNLNQLTSNVNFNNSDSIYYFGFDSLPLSVPIANIILPINKSSSGYYQNYTFEFFTKASNNLLVPLRSDSYYIQYNDAVVNILIYNPYFYYNNLYIKFSISSDSYCLIYPANPNFKFRYLSTNDSDFYSVYSFLDSRTKLDIFNKFQMLYASDDLIESKEAQQPLEDQIISDFTGNGSASATVGDAVNVKQASNAIKNGLNTGANSGVALDYAFGFNNPSGLFVWFSSDTAQYFTLYQPTRGITNYSDIEWTDDLPDHLSILDYKYLQGLNND